MGKWDGERVGEGGGKRNGMGLWKRDPFGCIRAGPWGHIIQPTELFQISKPLEFRRVKPRNPPREGFAQGPQLLKHFIDPPQEGKRGPKEVLSFKMVGPTIDSANTRHATMSVKPS